MKKYLFILMSIFLCSNYVFAQNISVRAEIMLEIGDIEGHQVNPEEVPKTRGIIFQPAHAYLYNKVISVSFIETMPAVTIKIINESTGETVYLQELMSPSTASIDLSSQNSGTYSIEISSDVTCLKGDFIL